MWLPYLLAAAAAQGQTPPAPAAPPPPCSAPEYRQLDFWVGEWDLSFAKADGSPGKATNRITRDEYGPCVISEHFEQPDIGYVGGSYSLYDRAAKQWKQSWVDNQGAYIALVGGPVQGQSYSFELKTVEPRGPRKAHFRMIWQDVTPDAMVWRWQEQQADGSYKDSWVINYKRRK